MSELPVQWSSLSFTMISLSLVPASVARLERGPSFPRRDDHNPENLLGTGTSVHQLSFIGSTQERQRPVVPKGAVEVLADPVTGDPGVRVLSVPEQHVSVAGFGKESGSALSSNVASPFSRSKF
jgi:hypothetical protein